MRARRLKTLLVTPAPPGSRKGNRVTALRWAAVLRRLGHRAQVAENFHGQPCDLLIALHARKSHAALARFRVEHPGRPLVLALTGTDLYGDIHTDASARRSLELADRLIVLQRMGVEGLPEYLRPKARVIYQSVPTPAVLLPPKNDLFEVCVVGHLRPVKDPFRTAQAARLLPASSRLRVLQLGGALSEDMEQKALGEAATNPRYRWLGELPRWKALRVLSRCRLLVLTSQLEGGANVIGEALACAVPVLSSRIAGSVGILGEDYPGYFPYGDTQALAALLHRAETDRKFYQDLKERCKKLRPLFDPKREVASWKNLLGELFTRNK
jgi:putative glycosyltransferase (TIGR04348 family)